MLGLWPMVLILLYYCELSPATAVALAVCGVACMTMCARDLTRPRYAETEGSLREVFLVACILFVPLIYLAWSVDGWLRFGWHNLLQAEAIYSVFLNGASDLGFSSHRMGYPYIGLLPLGVLSRTFDVVPTRLLLGFNFLALIVWVFSIYSFLLEKRDSRPMTRGIAVLSVIFLSGATYYVADKFLHLVGLRQLNLEFRASPVTTKFIHLDAMTWGIASLSMQYAIMAGQRWASSSVRGILGFLFGAQTILTYPLLGPCAILISGAHVLDAGSNGWPSIRFPRLVSPVGLSALLGGVLLIYGADKGTSTVAFATSITDIGLQLFNGVAVVAFVVALAAIGLRQEDRSHRLRVGLLCTAFGFAFVVLRLPLDVQYKFLYGILIVTLFHAAVAVATHYDSIVRMVGKPGPYLAAVVMCVAFAFYSVQLAQHLPPLRGMFEIVEQSWLIESRDSLAIKDALERMQVPLSSMTLLTDAPQPLVPFLRIPLYFYGGRSQVGYSMSFETMTVNVKAYSSEEFGERRSVSQRILDDCDEQTLRTTFARAPQATFLFAIKPESNCKDMFKGSPDLRWVTSLANGSEVFVEANASH
jgi:hypothetical protein